MKTQWLAIDLGSSFSKGALFDDTGILGSRQIETPENISAVPGAYEIDMNQYFTQINELLNQLIAPGVKGILISTQMHGFVVADEQFNPVTPYVSWQDKLGSTMVEHIRSEFGDDATRLSGVPIKPNLACCSLLARIRAGLVLPAAVRFCTLGSFVIGRLTGRNICHITNAAPTGLADVRKSRWNERLIEQSGLSQLSFPEIVADVMPVAVWNGACLFADYGDQQVCAYGAGLAPEADLHISIGTAGLMGALTAEWGQGQYENRPWLEKGLYLRTVSGLPGGNQIRQISLFIKEIATQISKRKISEAAVWQWLDRLQFDSIKSVAHDYFDLLSVFSLSPEQLALAACDTIADKYKGAADQLGLAVKKIAFSGGAAQRIPSLRRMIEAKLAVDSPGPVCDVMLGMQKIASLAESKGLL